LFEVVIDWLWVLISKVEGMFEFGLFVGFRCYCCVCGYCLVCDDFCGGLVRLFFLVYVFLGGCWGCVRCFVV